MTDECDRCEREFDDLRDVDLIAERDLCEGCVRALDEDVYNYRWQDRYTEEQHERALSLLSGRDEFECVISSYEDGQIILHTPYVSSDVVTDFCDHFGFQIISFGPQWEADEVWPCAHRHGDLFEIGLEYNEQCPSPIPVAMKFEEIDIEDLDENDKQF